MLPGSKLQRWVWRDVQKKKEGHHWYWRKMAVFVPSAVIRLPGGIARLAGSAAKRAHIG
jgi:hypothetical protein